MKKSVVVIPQMKKTKRARHCLFDERAVIDACLLVIDGSIRVCCNDFVTHTHTYTHKHTQIHTHTHTHTHTYIYTYTHTHTYIHTYIHIHQLRKPRYWSASTGPGQVTSKEGARGRINILKVLKATGPGAGVSPEGGRPGVG